MNAVGAPGRAAARLPLTGAQQGVWLAQALDPTSPVFNTADAVEIEGAIDHGALAEAIRAVITGAGALHVTFEEGARGPQQVRRSPEGWNLPVIDLRGETDPRAAADLWMAADLARPVDLAVDRLFATALLRTGAETWTWYLRIHHIATDAYATALLMRRVAERVSAAAAPASPLPPLALDDLDRLVAADAAYRDGPQHPADRAFWRERLRDTRSGPPATLAGQVAPARAHAVRATRHLDAATGAALGREAATVDASWPELLIAGFATNLASMTGSAEQVLAMPVLARTAAVRRAPGIAVNIVPLTVDADHERPLEAIVRSVRDDLRSMRPHQAFRFEEMARLLAGQRGPLFGPQVNLKPFSATLRFGTADGTVRNLATGPVEDLALIATPDSSGAVHLALDGNPSLYSASAVASHLDRIAATLEACATPGALPRRSGSLPTITPAERRTVVARFNDTTHAVPRETITDLLRAQARSTPDAAAVTDDTETVTYAELHRRAELLATALRAAGAGPGAIVGLSLERSVGLSVAVTAVMLAGAAYLPIDPDLPQERRDFMAASARPVCVITNPEDGAAWHRPVIEIDRGGMAQGASPSPGAALFPAPADAAYVIYTSGSTGQPKGVLTEHAALVNRLAWMQHHLPIGPGDAVLQKTPYGFDVSVWELLWPLIQGARLVMASPGGHRDPAYLAALIQAEAITTVHFVPSMLDLFLEEPAAAACDSLRHVVCSGEALAETTVGRYHQLLGAELHNLYGPTEAAIDVTAWDCHPGLPAGTVPIGRPIWNTRTYVLDPAGRPLPVGATGELWLAGANLAREYVGRPDLTAERFVADPLHAEWARETGTAPGFTEPRMYRTGDLARWRPDGALEYLGRIDDQVKLRGQRIELGEIEAILARHPRVARAAATVDRSGPAPRLVAHVVLRGEGEALAGTHRPPGGQAPDAPDQRPTPAELIAHAARALPEAMVPSAIRFADDLPLSPNGKLDRRQLPAVEEDRAGASAGALGPGTRRGRPATSLLEEQLCELFAETLRVGVVAPDDRFFDIGGDSLLAARLAASIRERLGLELTLGAVFAAPSPAALAARIDGGADLAALEPLLTLRAGGAAPPLFCIHPAGGVSWCYAGLARTIHDRPIVGIQAPAVRGEPMPASLAALASAYADLVEGAHPDGVCHLLGWSVGGVIAQAVAVELQRRGRETGLVALLDAYPGEQWADRAPPSTADALLGLLFMGGLGEDALQGAAPTLPGVLEALAREGSALASLDGRTVERIARVVQTCSELMRTHRTRVVGGDLTFFLAAAPRSEDWLDARAWRAHTTGTVHVHAVECTHPQMPRRGPLDDIGRSVQSALVGAAPDTGPIPNSTRPVPPLLR